MEKQIRRDFYCLLESFWDEEEYGEKPNQKRKEELFQIWKTEYVGLEYWDECLKLHNELHSDMGYWFGEFQEAIGDFMWSELRLEQ